MTFKLSPDVRLLILSQLDELAVDPADEKDGRLALKAMRQLGDHQRAAEIEENHYPKKGGGGT